MVVFQEGVDDEVLDEISTAQVSPPPSFESEGGREEGDGDGGDEDADQRHEPHLGLAVGLRVARVDPQHPRLPSNLAAIAAAKRKYDSREEEERHFNIEADGHRVMERVRIPFPFHSRPTFEQLERTI